MIPSSEFQEPHLELPLLQKIHREYEKPLTWIMAKAIDEASSLYEAVFGLINDWGGRVP